MADALRIKLSGHFLPVPSPIWRWQLARETRGARAQVRRLTHEHHLVRDWVVTEIGHRNRPLSPGDIAAGTGLGEAQVAPILDDLERWLFYLFRNESGEVSWAYPVTADNTPHHLAFESGERMTAA